MEADIEAGDEYEKGFKLDQLFKICLRVDHPLPDASQPNLNKPGRTNQADNFHPFEAGCTSDNRLEGNQGHKLPEMKSAFKGNIALYLPKQLSTSPFIFFITKEITRIKYTGGNYDPDADFIFPLYDDNSANPLDPRVTNLNPEIVNQLEQKLGLRYSTELSAENENASPVCYANSSEVTEDFKVELPPQMFTPIDILDYICAVLYSPFYSEKSNELLKMDFPIVPYPKSQFVFWKLVKSSAELRQIHLPDRAGD